MSVKHKPYGRPMWYKRNEFRELTQWFNEKCLNS